MDFLKGVVFLLSVLLVVGCSSSNSSGGVSEKSDSKFISTTPSYGKIVTLSESSGICYSDKSDTLFVACDNGWIYEISKNGDIINKQDFGNLKNHDFEGISYDAIGDLLFVVIEGSDNILVVNRNLKKQKTINVDRTDSLGRLILKKDKETGLEGIGIDERGEIYLANQSFHKLPDDDPSVIIQIDPLSEEIKDVIDPKYLNISGLSFYQGNLYMVSDTNNLLIKYDISNGEVLSSTKIKKFSSSLKNISIEGVTFDNDGNIYFADDQKQGSIFKYKFYE